jgi:phenylalanyl-tRNA synthetase beta chain
VKISINWIKEFVDLPSTLTAKQLAHDLTMATVEVEDFIDFSSRLDKVVVGIVKTLNKHPNADRLTVAVTDLGSYGVKDIVCGGANLKAGMAVAVAMPGAKVYWHGESNLTTLSEAEVRGVKSFGMICASSEIALNNLFPETSEKEILDISSITSEAGKNLSEVIGYNDIIFEIDNKSLTNRPDLWGHYGIAREFAAFYNLKLKSLNFPEVTPKKATDKLSVENLDKNLCPRYTAISISGVQNTESPFWLRSKLSKVGNKSHGFLVDLTNYVMLTLGEPTHVFDRDKIHGDKIIIRPAAEKEKIKLLDGKDLSLTPVNLVIADSTAPIALAGVMGGADSSVSDGTTKIVFESANFNAINIRKSSAASGTRTDSSSRFEKGLDPELCKAAGEMFINLLKEQFPKSEFLSLYDDYAKPPLQFEIQMEHQFISSRLGDFVDQKGIIEKLTSLGFTVKTEGQKYVVKVPSWRATGDVKIPEDLVEEVARVTGYDNIPLMPVKTTLTQPVFHKEYKLEKSMKIFLAETCGYQELYSYPWVSEKALGAFSEDLESACTLAVPPDQSTASLRTTLLPGLAEAASKNMRFFEEASLFELGKVFNSKETYPFSAKGEKLPGQTKYLAGIRAGKNKQDLFLKIKANINDLFNYNNLAVDFNAAENKVGNFQEYLNVISEDKIAGKIAAFNKKAKKIFDLQEAEAVIFELNFDLIKSLTPAKTSFKEIPKFPGVDFDLSLLFEKKVQWQGIKNTITSSDNLIESVSFIEEFYGKQIPEGKKAVVLRVLIRSLERTLTSDEVNVVIAKVLKNLEKDLGGELRKA